MNLSESDIKELLGPIPKQNGTTDVAASPIPKMFSLKKVEDFDHFKFEDVEAVYSGHAFWKSMADVEYACNLPGKL